MTQPVRADAPLILIADDVPANVELLIDQLHTLGYRTVSAQDGPSALAGCFEHRPELVILDVSMPAGDLGVDDRSTGFEVCRRIKRDARTARIPVIFVTALNDTTDRVKAIEAGGDDFLTKPHNRMVLGARVRSLLKLKAATDALEDSYRKLRELEKVRDDLIAGLKSIPDENGREIGTQVFRPEELYKEVRGVAPDLIVYFGGLYWRSVGTVGGGKIHTFENDTGPDGANHAENGMILWRPAGAVPGVRQLNGAQITDVAPTILEILGLPVPPDMEGKSLLN